MAPIGTGYVLLCKRRFILEVYWSSGSASADIRTNFDIRIRNISCGCHADIRDVPIPKFEPIPVPILNFKAKPIPILNRYRYLDFSVLKLFIYTAFYSKGDTS